MSATAEKTKDTKQQDIPPQDDDYSSGEGEEYESYSDDDDYDDPETDPDSEMQPQRHQQRRRPQLQQQQSDDDYSDYSDFEEDENDAKAMQPFDRIGGDETSMNGPVTKAREMRGEISPREGNPNQKMQTADKGKSSIDDEDGLKLKLEVNLEVEVELKASIHGDLTLALLA